MSNWLADSIDNVGTFFNLPDWGVSENQGGGATSNTGRVKYSGTTDSQNGKTIGNLVNTYYQSNQLSKKALDGMGFTTDGPGVEPGNGDTGQLETTYNGAYGGLHRHSTMKLQLS